MPTKVKYHFGEGNEFIPSYVLINIKGEIVDRNAPTPRAMMQNKAMEKLIKSQ